MPAFAKPLLQQPLSRTFRGERENRVIVDMILGPLKPSARWCFVAAKLGFGSCLAPQLLFDRALKAMLGIQVCGQQSSLKPRARCCFAAAKLDFGSCLLGSIPHTSVKLNCQKHGAFQVDGWTWDIASFAVLSRIFREIRLPKVASADS